MNQFTVKFSLSDDQLDQLSSVQLREDPRKRWTKLERVKLAKLTIQKIINSSLTPVAEGS